MKFSEEQKRELAAKLSGAHVKTRNQAGQTLSYVEGWFVVPDARRRGVGRALLAAAERWARAQGSRELASDTEADNEVSAAAHEALGFEEVGLVRCFRKKL